MTRGQIAEQIQRILVGGDPSGDTSIDIVELMFAIDQERDRLVGEYYKAKILAGDRQIDGSVLKRFHQCAINTDSNMDAEYVDLPEKIISLPYDMGVYDVSVTARPYRNFIRTARGHKQLYTINKSSDTSETTTFSGGGNGHNTWWLESFESRYRLYFGSKPSADGASTIDLVLLTSVSMDTAWINGALDTDNVQYPGGTPSETYPLPAELVSPLIRNVVQLYSTMAGAPFDSTQDNQNKA